MSGRPIFKQDQERPHCRCGRVCATNYRNKIGIMLYKTICNRCKKKKPNKKPHCENCGFIGDSCQLDIHHMDRNHHNNDPKNIQTLCANCHRLEHKKDRARN